MRLLLGFFKLVRLPNLVFIALTQFLFNFCIFHQLYTTSNFYFVDISFYYLTTASVLIAAGGYVINDYFDVNIDEVNKPSKMVVDKIISRRWAIAWHFILSSAGLVFTYLALDMHRQWYLLLFNLASIILLWLYSTNFKKSFLIGNLIISLLVAWTICVVFFSKMYPINALQLASSVQARFFRFMILYSAFAFLVTFIRELIKDVEDMPGDSKFGCKTFPIVLGVSVSRFFISFLLVLLILLLIVVEVYVLQFGWWLMEIYSFVFILIPSVTILIKTKKATTTEDFHALSSKMKWVMLAGILSMLFFVIYI